MNAKQNTIKTSNIEIDTSWDESHIPLEQVILLSLRACAGSRLYLGIDDILNDWFGSEASVFFQSLQTIVWANSIAGDIDCRFLPCASFNRQNSERLFLQAIRALNIGDKCELELILDRLSGRLKSFAIIAFEEIARILQRQF